MNYLVYIEHSAENLQFYLWYKDYIKRFNEAKTADISLAPEWTAAMEDEAVSRLRKERVEKMRPATDAAEIFKGTDFERPAASEMHHAGANNNPFDTPPRTPQGGSSETGSVYSEFHSLPGTGITGSSYKSQAADAFQAAGAKQPCEW